MRAVTTDAVRQNFEEDRKGTLEAGKFAGLVILRDHPLRVDPMAVKDIRAMQTEALYTAKG